MSTAIILGTRPEIIKMSPIIREFDRMGMEYFILHKWQRNKSKVIFQTGLTRSTGSIHRKARIGRIYTDHQIGAHPGDLCSIVNNLEEKISFQWLFYPVIEQGVAQWT